MFANDIVINIIKSLDLNDILTVSSICESTHRFISRDMMYDIIESRFDIEEIHYKLLTSMVRKLGLSRGCSVDLIYGTHQHHTCNSRIAKAIIYPEGLRLYPLFEFYINGFIAKHLTGNFYFFLMYDVPTQSMSDYIYKDLKLRSSMHESTIGSWYSIIINSVHAFVSTLDVKDRSISCTIRIVSDYPYISAPYTDMYESIMGRKLFKDFTRIEF